MNKNKNDKENTKKFTSASKKGDMKTQKSCLLEQTRIRDDWDSKNITILIKIESDFLQIYVVRCFENTKALNITKYGIKFHYTNKNCNVK